MTYTAVSIESACASLSGRALATAAELDDQPYWPSLAILKDALGSVNDQVLRVQQMVPRVTTVSPTLQSSLASQLLAFEETVSIMYKPLQRAVSGGPEQVQLDETVIADYRQCLSELQAVLGVFQTALHECDILPHMELTSEAPLTNRSVAEDQEHILQNAIARSIFLKAEEARNQVLQRRELVQDAKAYPKEIEMPPTYAESIATASSSRTLRPQPQQSQQQPTQALTPHQEEEQHSPQPPTRNMPGSLPVDDDASSIAPSMAASTVASTVASTAASTIPAGIPPEIVDPPAPASTGFFSTISESWSAMTASMRPKADPLLTALCSAVEHGDLDRIKGLLSHGADINGRNVDGKTPLLTAIAAHKVQIVRFLIQRGAAVRKTYSGPPPVYAAAKTGDVDLVRTLFELGAIAQAKHTSGLPYFVAVAAESDVEMLQIFLKHGADPNTRDLSGTSVFIQALRHKRLAQAKLLLERGASPNDRDLGGRAAVIIAAHIDESDAPEKYKLAEALLKRGVDPNVRDVSGQYLLSWAVQKRRIDIIKLLFQYGCDPNLRELSGRPILGTAVDRGDVEIAKMFSKRGANAKNLDARTQAKYKELLASKTPTAQSQPAPQPEPQPELEDTSTVATAGSSTVHGEVPPSYDSLHSWEPEEEK